MWYNVPMDHLTTAEVAAELGYGSAGGFTRFARRHGVEPVLKGPGIRGAQFWTREQLEQLRELTRKETA